MARRWRSSTREGQRPPRGAIGADDIATQAVGAVREGASRRAGTRMKQIRSRLALTLRSGAASHGTIPFLPTVDTTSRPILRPQQRWRSRARNHINIFIRAAAMAMRITEVTHWGDEAHAARRFMSACGWRREG